MELVFLLIDNSLSIQASIEMYLASYYLDGQSMTLKNDDDLYYIFTIFPIGSPSTNI
jgi:hypothetical protein